jgi:hypothetical protein
MHESPHKQTNKRAQSVTTPRRKKQSTFEKNDLQTIQNQTLMIDGAATGSSHESSKLYRKTAHQLQSRHRLQLLPQS